ncbi:DUF5134 domain-containing protein [Saccharopolyspora sp. NPDC050642]|uniref:DUF5134 domain-containing protein n=1 Tax=Saccharopolyspora sp. NPDC050642 TaxID=3157099 RepID=UPI0034100BB9
MIDLLITGAVIAVTAASLARLFFRRTSVDVVHALMGVGMVAMLVLPVLPAAVWAALFVACAGWMGMLALRRRPAGTYLHHAVGGLAMAYMFAAAQEHEPTTHLISTTHSPGHAHGATLTVVATQPAGFAFPLVAWTLAVYYLLSAGIAGTDLLRSEAKLATATELVLSLGMVYMFLTML